MLYNSIGYAWQINDIYSANIEVSHKEYLQDAKPYLQQALQQVLLKASGNFDILDKSAKFASVDVKQYIVRSELAEADGAQELRLLHVKFDAAKIDQLLKKSGIEVLGKTRPQILYWVSIKNNNNVQLLTQDMEESNSQELKLIERLSKEIALPYFFPLDTMGTMSDIPIAKLWKKDKKSILQASLDYRADVIVVINLQRDLQKVWVADWTVLYNNKSYHWDFVHTDLQSLTVQGINKLAKFLSYKYTVKKQASDKHDFSLRIENIDNYKKFQSIMNHFSNSPALKDVMIQNVEDDKIILKLGSLQELQKLENSLDGSKSLVKQNNTQNTTTEAVYRWKS